MRTLFIENLFWVILSLSVAAYQGGIMGFLVVLALWILIFLYFRNDALKMGLKIRPRYFVKQYPDEHENKTLNSYEFSVNEAAIDIARYKYLVVCYMKEMVIFREKPKHNSAIEGGYEVFIDNWFSDAESIYFTTFNDLKGKLESELKDEIREAKKISTSARNYYSAQFIEFKGRWMQADASFPIDYKLPCWIDSNNKS